MAENCMLCHWTLFEMLQICRKFAKKWLSPKAIAWVHAGQSRSSGYRRLWDVYKLWAMAEVRIATAQMDSVEIKGISQ